ncbi:unnamed protein product [Diplocarpon coronariae]|uniref:Uncharacterized protein n=1 Tax=Diplocarpon coronariae TaxID=2795749 RepID=A0A218ZC29_9HELO|nr:hypothetical protein B2J93_1646 [Marssonina coronariae]
MDALSSSPDPLNDSPTFYSPAKAGLPSRGVRHCVPLEESSPKKQTFELNVGNELSPQKIRVTVEAGETDAEDTCPYLNAGASSPTRASTHRRRERTTTTTIPVKGLSDSEDAGPQACTPKRGRGRPRKSGTPVAAKKASRASTPLRKNRKSIDQADGADREDNDYQFGKGVEISRGKRKSRSRSAKGICKSTPAVKEPDVSSKPRSRIVNKRGRGRPKSISAEDVEVLENASTKGNDEESGFEDNDDGGALEPIDLNTRDSPSAFPTSGSATAIGGEDTDVTIARFDPGNETPRRPGWSSPHTIQPPNSRPRADNYPSPSVSPARSTFSQHEDDDAPGFQRRESYAEREDYDRDQFEAGDEDEAGDMQDRDTILESEGFSMISVDSVPSLREHFSSPAHQDEKLPPSQVRKKSFLSIQANENAHEDSSSRIPGKVLENYTHSQEAQNPRLLTIRNTRQDDSFSSIPPEILEAATPARKNQVSRLLSKTAGVDDSFSSIAPEILQAATPHRTELEKKSSTANLAVNNNYEDSFSAIPPAILDAETPSRALSSRSSEILEVPAPRLSVSPSYVASPAPSRLLTPEETPSPYGEEHDEHDTRSNEKTSTSQSTRQVRTQEVLQDSSIMSSHLPSSPPSAAPRRYTYTAYLRQHRQLDPNLSQTPSIIFSSPALPPPIQVGREALSLAPPLEQSQRPTLSPTVRAGQMLQDIIIPSSPRSSSQSLGSPFKSPTADKRLSSSATKESYPSPTCPRLAGPLLRLDFSGKISESTSQLSHPSSSNQGDPLRSSILTQQRSPSPEDKQQYSLGLPEQRTYSDPRFADDKLEDSSILSDDAMSWQAEKEITLPTKNTSTNNISKRSPKSRDDNRLMAEQEWAAERAAAVEQTSNASSSRVTVIGSGDGEASTDTKAHDEDEDFGLLLETLNSSSPAVKLHQDVPREAVEKPRRSKLPSPWRQNSKRLVYSDELAQISSSPPAPKDAIAEPFAKEVALQQAVVRNAVLQSDSDDIDADLSGHRTPQKVKFQPRLRHSGNLDLTALLANSPLECLPTLSASSHVSYLQKPARSSQSSSSITHRETAAVVPADSNLKDSTGYTPIPQKMNFNPRPRAEFLSSPTKPASLVPNLFNRPGKENQTIKYPDPKSSVPAPKPLAASSLSRKNTLSGYQTPVAHLSPLGHSPQSALSKSSDKENQAATNSRTLKWTESLRVETTANVVSHNPTPGTIASPTKSCLRSPIKTPSANSGSTSKNLSPGKGVKFVSSSPLPSPPPVALSSRTWTKDHWRLLDTILQTWKPENNTLPVLSDEKENSARRRRNSTRVISRLLGKNVTSGDQKMRLEQWHLEAVDEFRGCVPGWQESVIAMRVFALLVGEEKRALGLAGGGKEGNYEHMN